MSIKSLYEFVIVAIGRTSGATGNINLTIKTHDLATTIATASLSLSVVPYTYQYEYPLGSGLYRNATFPITFDFGTNIDLDAGSFYRLLIEVDSVDEPAYVIIGASLGRNEFFDIPPDTLIALIVSTDDITDYFDPGFSGRALQTSLRPFYSIMPTCGSAVLYNYWTPAEEPEYITGVLSNEFLVPPDEAPLIHSEPTNYDPKNSGFIGSYNRYVGWNVPLDANFNFDTADSYQVYFGTDSEDLTLLTSGIFNWDGTNYYCVCPVLTENVQYFWRVDSVFGAVTLTGSVLSFVATVQTETITETVYEQNIVAGYAANDFYGDLQYMQSFIPIADHNIAGVSISLYRKSGENVGILRVSIRATDVAGLPTGSDLCWVDFDSAELGMFSWQLLTVRFDKGTFPYPLVSGSRYAIIVTPSSLGSSGGGGD